jgi:hypothetical protein
MSSISSASSTSSSSSSSTCSSNNVPPLSQAQSTAALAASFQQMQQPNQLALQQAIMAAALSAAATNSQQATMNSLLTPEQRSLLALQHLDGFNLFKEMPNNLENQLQLFMQQQQQQQQPQTQQSLQVNSILNPNHSAAAAMLALSSLTTPSNTAAPNGSSNPLKLLASNAPSTITNPAPFNVTNATPTADNITDILNKLINQHKLEEQQNHLMPNKCKPQQAPTSQQSLLNSNSSLYANKCCAWPDCSLTKLNTNLKFETFDLYMKLHLNIEHRLDEKSHKQLLKQIGLVESLELEMQRQKALLNDMLAHLNNQLEVFKQQQQQQQQNQQIQLQLNDLIAFSQLKQLQQQQQQQHTHQILSNNINAMNVNGVSHFSGAQSLNGNDENDSFNENENSNDLSTGVTVKHNHRGRPVDRAASTLGAGNCLLSHFLS